MSTDPRFGPAVDPEDWQYLIRRWAIEEAVKVTQVGAHATALVETAKAIEDYVLNGPSAKTEPTGGK